MIVLKASVGVLFRRLQVTRLTKPIWRPKPFSLATWKCLWTTTAPSLRLLSTNPSLVFDNGDGHLASPKSPEKSLKSLQLQDQSTSFWPEDPGWDQTAPRELFFDQVAELEKIISGENSKGSDSEKPWVAGGEMFGGNQEMMNGRLDDVKCSEQGQVFDTCSGSFLASGSGAQDQDGIRSEQLTACPSSVPVMENSLVDESQGSPSSVGSSCSDEALEKRIRNNQASKKFRRLRKERHKTLFARACKLGQENQLLRNHIDEMTREVVFLKSLLIKKGFTLCNS